MAEKKTMRDYIMGNQERTAPKPKTLGEYFIESKLDVIKRQLETLASSFCDHCFLEGHESEECPTQNLWDDCEIFHSDEQHNLHPPNRDINYIPPCLRRTCPKQAEEPNINETRTTLRQSTITELFQRYQDSISTHIQPKFESEAEVNLLTSGVDLNEDLTLERQVPTKSEPALTEESTYKGHESEECPTQNLWDDCEIVHSDEQHNLHPPNRDINYIPPCLRHTCPKQAEEPNINETRTTLRQSTITELFQRYQDSISTHIQPKFESEAEVNLLTSGVDLNEDLTLERQVPTKSEQALTEESTYKGHDQDLVVVDMEKSKESPTILGLTIGDVIIEVQKGKDSLEKIAILQDPSIMVDVSLRTSFSMKAPASKGSLLSAPYLDVLEQR
ncbi:hypothetical protein P8452_43227 [Trifolium repens]|nr:hypothetical protein P8452_43227 [Trifolium repens]